MCSRIPIARGFRRGSRAFLADARGLAAVELALILPVALMVMSLVVFGGQTYGVQRKVTLAATTVANIFAQANNTNASTITRAELDQILAYPSLILYPYDGSTAAVVVSQLLVTTSNGNTTGTVCGSWANSNGTPRTIGQQGHNRSVDRIRLFRLGQPMTIPSAATSRPTRFRLNYVVLGEVSYPFQATGLYFSGRHDRPCTTRSS